ncbi:MAG: alpha/beta hydrolase family protein [Usitatibacter sp.]
MTERRETAAAADGRALAVTRFPARGEAWATMVFGSAMGVRQDFYAPFARYLAGRGIHVLTFDYRGMGWSLDGSPAKVDVDVSGWAQKDLNAMLLEAQRAAPHLPLGFMGHSLGGQLLGVLPDNARVRAAINVTTGSGWYKFNQRMRLEVRMLWFVAMPLLTPLFGYFPGKALRMVGNLPRGVTWQWRRWCLHPEYILAEGEGARAAFGRVAAQILAYSFEDDHLITRTAIESLNGFYRNARLTHRHVAPADVGQARIGHFGFFAPRSEATLWKAAADWFRAELQPDSVPAGSPQPAGAT